MRVALKPSISSTFGQMVKWPASWGVGAAFFSEMCRKCNHQRAVCLYCQIQATHKGTCHACLNRLRHRHHRCSRPWRLLSSRSGRDAATTQTWIERIGRVAFIFACNHLSPTANASPGRSSTGASLLARTLHHGKNSAALAAHWPSFFRQSDPWPLCHRWSRLSQRIADRHGLWCVRQTTRRPDAYFPNSGASASVGAHPIRFGKRPWLRAVGHPNTARRSALAKIICGFGSPETHRKMILLSTALAFESFCPFAWQCSPALSTVALSASSPAKRPPPSARLTPMV